LFTVPKLSSVAVLWDPQSPGSEPQWKAVGEIRVLQGPTGLFVSFPAKKQRDGSDRKLAYPANAETRMIFQRVILAEYEKLVGKEERVKSFLASCYLLLKVPSRVLPTTDFTCQTFNNV
jgi:DNA-binding cell septation regulator SpoVG